MSSSHLPPDVSGAIFLLDGESALWSTEAQEAWRRVRGFVRTRQRQSQSLPALAQAAQEVVQVRDHAQAALAAMSGVFGSRVDQHHEEDPITSKHGKLPPEEPER